MERKIGQRLKLMLAAAVLLSGFSLFAAKQPIRFTKENIGKLFYLGTDESNVYIFDGWSEDGQPIVRKFGSTQTVPLANKNVIFLPFDEDVTPLAATEWLLYAYAHQRPHGWERTVADCVGDTTGRMAMIAEFELACNHFLIKLKKNERRAENHEELVEGIEDLWLEDNDMSEVLSQVQAGEDRILTIALIEAYRYFIIKNRKYFKEINELCNNSLENLQMEQLKKFAIMKGTPNLRQERFRKLYPKTRSLWTKTSVANYGELLQLFDGSLRAFDHLDKLSKLTEPEEWGSTMLDALLLMEGSPAGEELEKEFDAAIGEMEKNLQQKQDH